MGSCPDESARRLLEAVPLVMRTIRSEMRGHRSPDLSVPQFRALGFIDRNPGASVSDVAEHLGLTLPSVSHLVDGLAARRLASRKESREDRRRRVLGLTRAGRTVLEKARKGTQERLAARLADLSQGDRDVLVRAMALLRGAFGGGDPRPDGEHEVMP